MVDRERVVLEALGERAEVLLGEDRRGREDEHLLAVVGGLERGAQGDLRLAVAHVAADQAVHRLRALHVGLDVLDRLALVGRLLPGEARLELAQPLRVLGEVVALAALALGVEVEQLAGQLLGRAAGARLERLPRLAAELGQRRVRAARADVAADLGQLVDGHEDLVGARELEAAGSRGRRRRPSWSRSRRSARRRGPRGRRCRPCAGRRRSAARRGGRGRRPARLGAAAAEEPVLGQDGELQAGGDEAVAQAGLAKRSSPGGGGAPSTTPARSRARL